MTRITTEILRLGAPIKVTAPPASHVIEASEAAKMDPA